MKKYTLILIGIVELILSFIWMTISQSVIGPHLVLIAISGMTIEKGIEKIRKR